VKPDVPLDHFSHQSAQSATTRGHKLERARAFLLGFKGSFDSVKLTANAANPNQQFFFIALGMGPNFLSSHNNIDWYSI
jgi:hypothetical protein